MGNGCVKNSGARDSSKADYSAAHPESASLITHASTIDGMSSMTANVGGSLDLASGSGDPARSGSKETADVTASGTARPSGQRASKQSRKSGASGEWTVELRHVKSGIEREAVGKPFPKRPMGCKLSQAGYDKIEFIFRKMDPDGSNAVTKNEAKEFFKCAFGNLSVDAMFNEVDVDGSGAIDAEEFLKFWVHVRKNGYKEQDILDELDELAAGGAWVDWKDGRDTAPTKKSAFPKRPVLCRISQKCWTQCEDLFKKIDTDGAYSLTEEKARSHFTAAFGGISVEAMFNEIDENHHGQITPKEWMKFWLQVRTSGYKEKDIMEELEQMMEGSAWVDWKDGRNTA